MSHERLFINATLTRLNPHYVRAGSPTQWKAAARPELDDALELLLAMKA
ncbi:MAG: hypothetical protein H0V17_16595 [Deltaproteobacteria bacterium]|nr:hypothetical protein [Deltaproteobacteria bacterium]